MSRQPWEVLIAAARSQRRPSSWADLPPLHQAAVGVTSLADAAVAEGRATTAMLLNTGVPELLIQVQDKLSPSELALIPHLYEDWLCHWDYYVLSGVAASLSSNKVSCGQQRHNMGRMLHAAANAVAGKRQQCLAGAGAGCAAGHGAAAPGCAAAGGGRRGCALPA